MSRINNIYIRFFLGILLISLVACLQIAVIASLPYPFNQFNLIIVFLVLSLFIFSFKNTLYFILGLGIISDIYALSSFSLNTLCLAVTAILTYLLLANFFTNRSLYSFLALTFFSFLTFQTLFVLLDFILTFFIKPDNQFFFTKYFFVSRIYGLMLDTLFVAISFYILNFISTRYKPFFLIRKIK